jgi:hypothetical protein
MKKGLLLIALLFSILSANAQKITGKYWVYSNVSSLSSENSDHISQVDDSFQGIKIFFDKDGEFEIYLADKKSFTYNYEWDANSEDLFIAFTGDGSDNQYIKFLKYYDFRCSIFSEGTLILNFYTPGSLAAEKDDAKPEFSMFFNMK